MLYYCPIYSCGHFDAASLFADCQGGQNLRQGAGMEAQVLAMQNGCSAGFGQIATAWRLKRHAAALSKSWRLTRMSLGFPGKLTRQHTPFFGPSVQL